MFVHKFSWIFVGVLVVLVGCQASGMVGAGDAGPVADPCEGVSCGERGECVSTQSGEAACRCDTGSHAEGLTCVANVEGAECTGVDCSGHGTCAVAEGPPAEPVCLCDEGFDVVGKTNCVAEATGLRCGAGTHEEDGTCVADIVPTDGGTPRADAGPPADAPCRSTADCDDGEACSYDTGECVTIAGAECGLPPVVGGGFRGLFGDCGYVEGLGSPSPYRDEGLCGDGLTCVATYPWLVRGTSEYAAGYGYCFQACDPCASECPGGMECVALSEGGGFCHAGPLQREGESCGGGGYGAAKICEAGTACIEGVDECRRVCTPNDGVEVPLRSPFTVAYPSGDCQAGEICGLSRSKQTSDADADLFTCREGIAVATAEPCSSADSRLCSSPDSCGGIGICSPVCESSADCAAGVECFDFSGWDDRCIPDGSLQYGAKCSVDRNCGEGLACKEGVYFNSCQLP